MIVTLAGGVGAARFLEGLVQVVPPDEITAIVNTGDDFELHGLYISPDLDIVTCTLADLIDRKQGWGIIDDTLNCMDWAGPPRRAHLVPARRQRHGAAHPAPPRCYALATPSPRWPTSSGARWAWPCASCR